MLRFLGLDIIISPCLLFFYGDSRSLVLVPFILLDIIISLGYHSFMVILLVWCWSFHFTGYYYYRVIALVWYLFFHFTSFYLLLISYTIRDISLSLCICCAHMCMGVGLNLILKLTSWRYSENWSFRFMLMYFLDVGFYWCLTDSWIEWYTIYSFFILLQLADAKDVMEAVRNLEGARLPVLTPNLKVSNCFQKKGKNHEFKAILSLCEREFLISTTCRDLKQLLQLVLRKLPSLLQLLSPFQSQTSIVVLKRVSLAIVLLPLLLKNSQFLSVGMPNLYAYWNSHSLPLSSNYLKKLHVLTSID